MAANGGPSFTFTPAISLFVDCETSKEVEDLWEKLSEGGTVLMPLDKYPFSDKFGWLMDKFGVSWQLNEGNTKQTIIPFFMFVGEQHGKAEDAMNLYTSMFNSSGITKIERYGTGEGEPEGTIKQATFLLNGQEFMAIDSGGAHHFTFADGISLYVSCETQEEIDELWEKLSEDGETEECGWLKDKYGVYWQIAPTIA